MQRGTVIQAKDKSRLLPVTPIRVESELFRFPIHNLSRSREVEIDITEKDKAGREIHWSVAPNKKYGHPGELAYKIDTHIINRRIDEAGGKIPKILPIGTLKEIASELGLGGDTNKVKTALQQNASAYINIKISYVNRSGEENSFEFGATRYDIIFRGNSLPDGGRADQVYIVFHDLYVAFLNSAKRRPLDYDYLRALSPSSQRFYELIAPKMYAAIKHRLPCVKYLYSDYCLHAAQTRYLTWDQAKKQLYKVVKPHRDSDYLAQVTYRALLNGRELDWEIILVPGPRAEQEYRVFTTGEYLSEEHLLKPPSEISLTEKEQLTSRLKVFGIEATKAQELSTMFPDRVSNWLTVAEGGGLSKKVKNVPGYLIRAIEQDYSIPQVKKKTANTGRTAAVTSSSLSKGSAKPDSKEVLEFREFVKNFDLRPGTK